MTVETNLEREFKFDVDPDFDPPDLRPVVGRTERLPEQHLTTTYFDTADHRLWAQGITLRSRVEDSGEAAAREQGKWTLKLPEGATGGDGLSRSELSWKGGPAAVPPEAEAVIAGLVRRAPLEPVVALSTERRRLLLHGGNGAWAEIDDDLVTVESGRRKGMRFRQIELELLGDEAGEVAAVLKELRRAGADPGGAPKLALAAGLDELQGTEEPDTSLAGAVRLIIERDLDRLLTWDYRLRIPAAAGDPASLDVEAVHQSRVAARRLRSDVQTMGDLLDPVWSKHVVADLKWIGRILGRVRDLDVLEERLLAHHEPDDAEAVGELGALLRSERHLEAMEVHEALVSPRYADMLERINAAVQAPPLIHTEPDGSVQESIAALVKARRRSLESEIGDLGRHPDDAALHRVRIRAKRLRYAAEASEPFIGKGAARSAAAAKKLQSVLGNLVDATNGSRMLRELASHPSVTPAVAFAAGRIAGRDEGEAVRLRREWKKPARRASWSRRGV